MSSVTVFSQYGLEARWNKSDGYTVTGIRRRYATEAEAVHAAQRKARRLVERLAKAICVAFAEDLTAAELAKVRELNRLPKYVDACASHDFMDSNMSVWRAFTATLGREHEWNNERELELMSDAWAIAYEKEYRA